MCMIFDVKMEDFCHKSRLLLGGHLIEPLATITYASIVSRDTVGINLELVSLNDFSVKVADIQNDYITAPVTEKIWTVMIRDSGEDYVRKAIVLCDLYGLNSTKAAFWDHLA